LLLHLNLAKKWWRNGLPHGLISQISRVEFVRRTGTSKNMLVVS
jgi:hypothetical protein